jgi:hypothetical protein
MLVTVDVCVVVAVTVVAVVLVVVSLPPALSVRLLVSVCEEVAEAEDESRRRASWCVAVPAMPRAMRVAAEPTTAARQRWVGTSM